MLSMLARDWWVFAIRGIAAIVFGIGAFVFPDETLNVLVWMFGAYLLVDGAVLLFALVSGDPIARRNGWAVALISILNLALGLAAFVWTDTVALSMLYVVAFWSLVSGTLQVVSAVYLRRELQGEFWLALGGVVSVAFGILLIAFPSQGLLSLVWLVAIWAIGFGISSLGLAYRLHGLSSDLKKLSTAQ